MVAVTIDIGGRSSRSDEPAAWIACDFGTIAVGFPNVFAALKSGWVRICAVALFAVRPSRAQSIRRPASFFGFTKLTTSSDPLLEADIERSSGPVVLVSTLTAVLERCGLKSANAWYVVV